MAENLGARWRPRTQTASPTNVVNARPNQGAQASGQDARYRTDITPNNETSRRILEAMLKETIQENLGIKFPLEEWLHDCRSEDIDIDPIAVGYWAQRIRRWRESMVNHPSRIQDPNQPMFEYHRHSLPIREPCPNCKRLWRDHDKSFHIGSEMFKQPENLGMNLLCGCPQTVNNSDLAREELEIMCRQIMFNSRTLASFLGQYLKEHRVVTWDDCAFWTELESLERGLRWHGICPQAFISPGDGTGDVCPQAFISPWGRANPFGGDAPSRLRQPLW